MLTITTNKAEVRGIADGSIRERTLPITDFWKKRIVNLLGFSDSDERTILHNLTEGRTGTTDAEREVTFTAGGVAAVRVKVTIRIGQQSGGDCFILTIRDVLEARERQRTNRRQSRNRTSWRARAAKQSAQRTRPPFALWKRRRDSVSIAIRRGSLTHRRGARPMI